MRSCFSFAIESNLATIDRFLAEIKFDSIIVDDGSIQQLLSGLEATLFVVF